MGTLRDSRFVHASWLPGLMTGDKQCQWAAWFKSNYRYDRVLDGDDTGFQVAHTVLLTETRKQLKAAGNTVLTEQDFRWTRESGLKVLGKADLIGLHPDGSATVYELKSTKPRQAHIEQVLLYMYFLPRANKRFADMRISGEVVYESDRISLEAGRIDSAWEARLHYFLDLLDTDDPAEKVPSRFECLYCKIAPSDCSDRHVETASDDGPWDEDLASLMELF